MKSTYFDASVIIPAVGRKSIFAALKSIQLQWVKPREVIVISQSCSLTRLLNRNSPLTDISLVVLNISPTSAACARNLGVSHASCKFLLFLDDDDIWLPSHVLECQSSMRAAVFSVSSAVVFDNCTPLYISPSIFSEKNSYGALPSWCIKTDTFIQLGSFNESLQKLEDYDFVVRYLDSGRKIMRRQAVTIAIQVNSATRQSLSTKPFSFFKMLKQLKSKSFSALLRLLREMIISSQYYKLVAPIRIYINRRISMVPSHIQSTFHEYCMSLNCTQLSKDDHTLI